MTLGELQTKLEEACRLVEPRLATMSTDERCEVVELCNSMLDTLANIKRLEAVVH